MYEIISVIYKPQKGRRPIYKSQIKSYASKLIVEYRTDDSKIKEKNIIDEFHKSVGTAINHRVEALKATVPYVISDFTAKDLEEWFAKAGLIERENND